MLSELGDDARRGRLERGLSEEVVAHELAMSRNQLRRIESGLAAHVSLVDLSRLLAVLGLDLSARAYPAGTPLRDAAHLALLQRLHLRLPDSVTWAMEVPLPDDRDLRSWDAVLGIRDVLVGVEAETRLRDVQSVLRRVDLKQRDDRRVSRVILLLSDTRLNRDAIRAYSALLRDQFPVPSVAAIQCLARGADPRANAIVLL